MARSWNERLRALRGTFGFTETEMARLMKLAPQSGAKTIRDCETCKPVSGPMQLALEALEDGWRPRHFSLVKRRAGAEGEKRA